MTNALLEEWVRGIAPSVITIAVALLVYYVVRRSTRALARHGQITAVMALLMRRTVRWFLIGSTTLIVLQQTGIFAQAWALLSAVFAALAVAFVASWSVLNNVTCAMILLIYRPFRVGDEIELLEPDGKVGVAGRVVDLNLLYTTVHEASNAVVRVPNQVFVQKYSRVRRQGTAPDPTRDSKEPFFTITPGTRYAHHPAAQDEKV
jgi:small-conductance mechanosensitive channel